MTLEPIHVFLAFVVLLVVGAMLAIVVRKRRGRGAVATLSPPVASGTPSAEATDSTPPSVADAKLAARTSTQREQRQEEIRQRLHTGLCRYCDRPATWAIPQLVLVRSRFDVLYRYFGMVPVNRWKIEITPGIEVPQDVCGTHQAMARSHLEKKVAENQVDYASFVVRQKDEMYEWESFMLDERMLDDANAVKRGKKQKKLADVAQLPQRGLKVATNGG